MLPLIALSSLVSLYAEEQAIPATAGEAFTNHFNATQKFMQNNKHELKIAGNALKIVGAIALLHLFQNIKGIRPHVFLQNAGFCAKMIKPAVWVDGEWDTDNNCYKNVVIKNLAVSFLSIPPIAAYLFGSGSYGIYNTLMKKQEERLKDGEQAPVQNTEKNASKAIAPIEEKKELTPSENVVQPEENNRPKYTPIRLSSNE